MGALSRTKVSASCLAVTALLFASCTTPPPSFEDVAPAEDLYAEGQKILRGTNFLWVYRFVSYTKAIETFQSIIDNYPYSDESVKAELKIADAYFADERWEEALSYYRDFADLHPQHEKVPYTILRSAQCHYEQIGSVNRDQTSTHEAVHFLEILLREHPYAPETAEGERMMQELRTDLAKNVILTGDFYLDRGEFQAAAERYRSVLNMHPGLGLDAEALFKLGVCYENLKREDEALRLFHVLMENFRESKYAQTAREHIAASN
jgi:outer membrane protein assembly factor BamD